MTTDDDLRTRYNPLEAADAVIADLRADNERLLSRVANAETDRDVTAERLAAAEAERDEFELQMKRRGLAVAIAQEYNAELTAKRAAERAAHAQTAAALARNSVAWKTAAKRWRAHSKRHFLLAVEHIAQGIELRAELGSLRPIVQAARDFNTLPTSVTAMALAAAIAKADGVTHE